MYEIIIHGFILGLAYVMPIGTQNLYVIQYALQKNKFRAYQISFFIFLFDISLAVASFYGIGYLLKLFDILNIIVLSIGFSVIILIGLQLIFKSIHTITIKTEHSFFKGIFLAFIVTWFNPQAIIDGTLLLGAIHSTLDSTTEHYFILGVSLASFFWFHTLTTIVLLIHKKIDAKILKIMNIICGVVLIFYGLKIGYQLLIILF